MRLTLILLATIGLAACERQQAPQPEAAAEASAGPTQGVDRSKAGQPFPNVQMSDAEGKAAMLASVRGEPVLVNLWATWCAPCVKELPTLQELDAGAGAPRVIAVSQDMASRTSVDAFIEDLQLGQLEVWHDPDMALSEALGAEVLPTTILYDAQGREVWRYVGDLDWTGEEAARLLAEASAGGQG